MMVTNEINSSDTTIHTSAGWMCYYYSTANMHSETLLG